MLTAAAPGPDLPPRCAAEPKWDGFRALMSWDASGLVLRSRQGTDLLPAFPEVRVGAAQMPDATALDGEIVVWEGGRLGRFFRITKVSCWSMRSMVRGANEGV
ncbi:hypothetical protein SOM70_36530 [Streptomyces salinarius]|uniref:ATP-dependent DNA ligase n=1 Tax=Streptomyces salinarius TaxID=2762598 RepID=UPI0032DEB008